MFRRSLFRLANVRKTGGLGLGSNNGHHLNHMNQTQVVNAINQSVINKKKIRPFRTALQIIGIIFGTLTIYSGYQVAYKKHKTFIPFYISKTRRKPYNFEVDDQVIKTVAEEQLLERLSLNPSIQQKFKLPITLSPSTEFEVWIEEKDASIKGIEISPNKPFFKRTEKPIRLNKYFNGIMEPLGIKDEEFQIPVVNKNETGFDVWFLGTSDIRGNNGKEAQIIYKGIFDSEHIKQARIMKAHLIDTAHGKKRTLLWD